MYVSMCTYPCQTYVCMYIHIHIYTYLHVYAYMHIYIYIWLRWTSHYELIMEENNSTRPFIL